MENSYQYPFLKIIILSSCIFIFIKNLPEKKEKESQIMVENKILSSIDSKIFKNIKNEIEFKIEKRTKLLEQESLKDWVDFNKKENLIYIDKKPYYFFIFKSISDDKNLFQVLAHHKKKFINMTWNDIYDQQQNNFLFMKEKTNEKLIEQMYMLSKKKKNDVIVLRYYWTDPIKNEITLKESIIKYWEKDGESGIIGSGYTLMNLSDNIKITYKDYTYHLSSFVYIFMTGFVSILLLKRNIILSLTFLIISFFSYIKYENSEEYIGSNDTEMEKNNSINSMLLSLSFLVGVNVFIIKSIQQRTSYKPEHFQEIIVLFTCSVSLILLSIINFSSPNDVDELMSYRISKQLIFNLAVFLNIVIIFTYFLHSTSSDQKKIVK